MNKYEKQYAKELDPNFVEHRDIDQKEKIDFIYKKFNVLPIHKEFFKIDSNKTQMDYDATSLYPSVMWDQKSLYSRTETGYAFKPDMNDVYVEAFNNQTFNQDGDESAILRIK